MELAGAFLTMVAPRPWNGPLSPFTWNAVFTLPSTPVKAAAERGSARHCQTSSVASTLHGLLRLSKRCKHNVALGLPITVQELWHSTGDPMNICLLLQ